MLTSSTSENVSFVETIYDKINQHTHTVCEDEWIHFLQDHYLELKEHSTYVALNEATLYRYRYRIADYLAEQHNMKFGTEQAFRIVNRLHNDQDFKLGLLGVWVPDVSYVSSLRHRYSTNKAMEKRN